MTCAPLATACLAAACGDDVVDTGEECEPPNTASCDASCQEIIGPFDPNGCYVVAVNRTGFEPTPGADPQKGDGIDFWGRSFVAAPDGSFLQSFRRCNASHRRVR